MLFGPGIATLKSRPNLLEEEHDAVEEAMPRTLTMDPGSCDPGDGVSTSVAGSIVRDLAGSVALEVVAREVGLLCAGPIGALIGWGISAGIAIVLTCHDVDRNKGSMWFYGPADTS
jgi:hypothetical protein